MSEETMTNVELDPRIEEEEAVDVFTHSKTAFPGAWTEEQVSELLGAWREVVERTRPSARRFNVAQRVLRRYRAKGNATVTIDVIRRQIKTLRTEYKVYQGLCKIGIKAHRAPCVDQLELILDKIPAMRRKETPPSAPPTKGPLRRGARRTRAYSEGDTENHRRVAVETEEETDAASRRSGDPPSDQEASPKSRGRYQRVNMPRLVRVMVEQQQSVMERLERLFQVFETFNKQMLTLLDSLVALQQQPAEVWRAPTPNEEQQLPLIVVQDADN